MPFPKIERVLYGKNPIDKVICQLRFPPILRIETGIPSDFQDAIIENFPIYTEKVEFMHETTTGLNSNFKPELINQLSKTSKNHEFSSEDKVWKINLTRSFLSISTTKYTKWEDFLEMFKPAITALLTIYKPPFFTRIGLRYFDIFVRSILGLDETNWSELFQSHFIGILSSSIKSDIKYFENLFEVKLNDDVSIARIKSSFVEVVKPKELSYMIDSDFYYPKRVNNDISELELKLDYLHTRASRLIRWVITEKLHDAMEPREL